MKTPRIADLVSDPTHRAGASGRSRRTRRIVAAPRVLPIAAHAAPMKMGTSAGGVWSQPVTAPPAASAVPGRGLLAASSSPTRSE